MSKSFQEWLDSLPIQEKTAINEQRSAMEDAREKYKEAVLKYYEENPPFQAGRSSDIENIKKDLKDFHDLVTECLRIGDLEILFKYGINPIFGHGGKLGKLADPSKLDKYEAIISEGIAKSKTDLERLCIETIKDKFRDAIESSKTIFQKERS
jgi:hypothetical protein